MRGALLVTATALDTVLPLDGFISLLLMPLHLHVVVFYQGLLELIWQSVQAAQQLVTLPDRLGQARSSLPEQEI